MNRTPLTIALALSLSLVACNGDKAADDTGTDTNTDDTGTDDPVDADQDGFDETEDCDDLNNTINPDATEICDGVDNDCDGLIDDADDSLDASTTGVELNVDADGDGYGDPASTAFACAEGEGLVDDDQDCDDADPNAFPGNPEVCDTVDNDCSGLVDDIDADGDGWFDAACSGDDCNDADAAINPGAEEICDDFIDQDCDGGSGTCAPTGDYGLIEADAIFRGEGELDRAAQGDPGLASAGDLDGDGFGDIIVGAIRNDEGGSNAGAAYVAYGPLSGEKNLSAAEGKITGALPGDFLGRSVNGVGDTNDDGFDDVLVSSLYNDLGGIDAGAAYLFHGPVSGTQSAALAVATILGENDDDQLADVEALGDTNGDGMTDLLMAAQFNSNAGTSAGAAYILLAPTEGVIDLATAIRYDGTEGDEFGTALGAGDFNGDGLSDMLVSAQGADDNGEDSGTVYLFEGPITVSGSSADAASSFLGSAAGDGLGSYAGVASAGDVNGDGLEDIVLGARENDGGGDRRGAIYLMYGTFTAGDRVVDTADTIFQGGSDSDIAGDSVDGLGDFDGDGFGDLVVGSGYADLGTENGGAAYLILGPPPTGTVSLADSQARFLAEDDNDRVRVQAAGDVDNDGRMDMLVGAQNNDENGADAGAAYLIYGTGL